MYSVTAEHHFYRTLKTPHTLTFTELFFLCFLCYQNHKPPFKICTLKYELLYASIRTNSAKQFENGRVYMTNSKGHKTHCEKKEKLEVHEATE